MKYHQLLVSREFGGAGTIALSLSHHLIESGEQCRVWLPGSGPAQTASEKLGLEFSIYNANGAVGRSKVLAGLANWSLGRALKLQGPGLVHVHSPGHFGALHWGLKRSSLIRIAHVHLEEPPELLRWAFRKPPDVIVTCAQFLVGHVERNLSRPTRVVAIPNSVDTSRFTPGPKLLAKQRVGAHPDRPLAVMLANLSPHKGQKTVIRTAALLKSRGVDIEFWLAGVERAETKTYTPKLQALIQELGVGDRVRLLGQRSDAPMLLQAADVFLLPSTCEGLPLSVLEAQASKTPVVAAPTAGVPEVVQDCATGFLVAADDVDGYADRITQLLKQPDLAQRLCAEAYDQIRSEYSWDTYCRRIMAVYGESIQDRYGAGTVRVSRDLERTT